MESSYTITYNGTPLSKRYIELQIKSTLLIKQIKLPALVKVITPTVLMQFVINE